MQYSKTMKAILNNFLHSGYNFLSHEDETKYKFLFINSVYGFAAFVILILAMAKYFNSDILIGISNMGLAIITIFSLLLLRKNKKTLHLVSNILIMLTFIVFFTIFLYADAQMTRMFIFFFLIAAVYFLQGSKMGLFWLLFTILSVTIVQATGFIDTKYSDYDILLMFLYLSIFYLILNKYEQRNSTQTEAILHLNENLEKIVRQRTQKLEEEKESFKILSSTDSLTGLYNRMKIEELFNYEQKQSLRYNSELSLILMDLDYFKSVNDTYGHNAGDNFLKEIALELKFLLRDTDIIGRWGGEEFLILLPKTDLETAHRLAQELRKNIQNNVFSGISDNTASFGVAVLHHCETLNCFINRADKALYIAKANGRNSVVSA